MEDERATRSSQVFQSPQGLATAGQRKLRAQGAIARWGSVDMTAVDRAFTTAPGAGKPRGTHSGCCRRCDG